MKEQNIKNIVSDAIENAVKLKWIKVEGTEMYIHIADVEKIIYGIFNEGYIERLIQIKEELEKDTNLAKESEGEDGE
jgi:hypothetical protein